MGLFSKVKKGLSSLWKGVKNVVKKVTSAVGKLFGSNVGKALLIVSSVFTLGSALAAGQAAWSAAAANGQNMLGKFVAAAGDFVKSLVGMKPGAQQAASETAGAAGTASEVAQAESLASGQEMLANVAGDAGEIARDVATTTPQQGSAASQAISDVIEGGMRTEHPLQAVAEPALPAARMSGGSPVARALNVAMDVKEDYAEPLSKWLGKMSENPLVGQMIKGYAEGRQLEEIMRQQRRQQRNINRSWRDADMGSFDWQGSSHRGYGGDVGGVDEYSRKNYVPYRRPQGA